MGISCKIKVKHNFKKIEKIQSDLQGKIGQAIEDVLKNIQGYAIRLERGHKSEGILIELVNMQTNEIKGRVYADPSKFLGENGQSYLWFEYFGTGQYAEQEHIGNTKHFIETGYTEWYIPVHKVGRKLNFPITTINNTQFYVATGMKANHFLTDAEFKTRAENKEIIKKKINEIIKEACK